MSDDRGLQPTNRRSYRIAGMRDRAAAPTMMSAGHIDDLAPAYALGALEPDEMLAVDAHIRGCRTCQDAVDDAQRTAGMLSYLATPRIPSVDTKAALFARVAHAQRAAVTSALPTHSLEQFRTPTIPASTGFDDLVVAAAPAGVATAIAAPSRQSRTGWMMSILSVPLLIALVATGMWGLQMRNQLSAQDFQMAELQSELTNFGSGANTYQLSPGQAAPQAEGKIVIGADQKSGMLQIDTNTKNGPQSFALWATQNDKLVQIGQVTVDQEGQGQARLQLDQPYLDYENVQLQAQPLDASAPSDSGITLFQDNGGSLGSTGSGMDVGP